MENNNSIQIRKYITLVESLNSKLLINENDNFLISESKWFSNLKLTAKEIEPVFDTVKGDIRFTYGNSFLPSKGVKNVDDFAKLVGNDFKYVDPKLGTFVPKEIKEIRKAFELSILRSPSVSKKLIEAVTDQLVQNNVWKNKYKSIGTEVDLFNTLKKEKDAKGVLKYSDQSAKSLAKKHFANKGKKPIDPNKPKPVDPNKPTPPPPDPDWLKKLKGLNWKKALAYAAGAGVSTLLLWYLFKQDNIVPDDMDTTPPIDPNNEWAPCLKKILDSKQGRVEKLSSGNLVVKVKNTTYPDGVLFFADGKVLTNNGQKKGTWKCKGGKVQPIDEQSSSNITGDVEIMIDLLDFPVTESDLIQANKLLQKYVNNGQGKQFLQLYNDSGLADASLETSLNYIATFNPGSVQAKNQMYEKLRKIKTGKTGGGETSTGDPLDGIEITWDDKKKKDDDEIIPIKKDDMYKDCPNFPLYFGCKGPLVSQLQKCLGMSGADGKLGPNTKSTAEAWGKSNNISTTLSYPGGGGEKFGITEYAFKKICSGKPVPEPTTGQTSGTTTTTITGETPTTTGTTTTTTGETPTKTDTIDPTKKLLQDLGRNGHLEQRRKNKWVYKGPDLTPEEEKLLIKYFKGGGFEPKNPNEAVKDWKRGDKIVFKRTGSYDEE